MTPLTTLIELAQAESDEDEDISIPLTVPSTSLTPPPTAAETCFLPKLSSIAFSLLGVTRSPTASTFSLGLGGDAASSATSYTPDARAVSKAEAQSYYAGLHSEPTLLYRTGKEWSPPSGPEAQRRLKELREVFNHPITKVWNHDLGWRVVKVMDAHTVRFTTIDVDVLALLKDYQITDVDVDFRESFYTREAGPRLLEPVGDLDPLVDVARRSGTMALYLAEGGGSDNLLGLSCRHVLIGSKEANVDYVRHPKSLTNLVDSIKLRIGRHGITAKRWRKQIEGFEEREKGTNAVHVEKAKAARIETEGLLDKAGRRWRALGALLDQVNKDWKKLDNRVLGHILRPQPSVNRAKLGDGFQGNKMDLGTKRTPDEFTVKCFPAETPTGIRISEDRGNATNTTIGRANGVFSIVRDYFQDMSINQTSMEWGIINYDSKSEVFSNQAIRAPVTADIRGRIGGCLPAVSGKTKSSDITYATPFWWLLERIKANGFPDAHLGVVA
ncbi:hypothetical protein B0H17DRAFT_1222761 [Mycena rosella]|uniref:Uncharacterized protein n=1 Tax=Mycena rosella TaxID=1033263 RepID=A0AAD7AXH7_MYCRO|nr:hypothetical protein B0H17DRAFT_1222761 [Mycena rosella]